MVSDKKLKFAQKLKAYFETYSKILIVGIDNVSSNLMQKIRVSLRGQAEILCGKNTLVRRIASKLEIPGINALISNLKGNVALVFTNEDVRKMKELVLKEKTLGPARVGQIAPCEVIVPAGNTGLEPTMTSFMQALNIATKISRGSVEILNPVNLIKKGDKVGASEAALLQKLGILPFYFGMNPLQVFEDGACYPASVLEITDEELMGDVKEAICNVTALSMGIEYPNMASIAQMMNDGFRDMLAIANTTSYDFPLAARAKGAMEAAAQTATVTTTTTTATTEAPVEEKPVEKEEPEETFEGMGGLFDF